MDREAVKAKVLEVVAEVLPDIDVASIDMAAAIASEYGVNSVSIIQLIVELENEFGISFDDTELALGLYYDMNDVVAAVAAKVS